MNGNISTLDRRISKLEESKFGFPAYGSVVRLLVRENEDEDRIIDKKRKSGEIKPDTLVIVRKIVGPSALSASERVPTRFNS
jgi:hypothetical protein